MPKITRIEAFQVDLPLHEGSYNWSGGNSVEVFDSTVVAVHTDGGLTGYGEVCPLGPAYLPAYAEGARTGIAKLAPQLIGLDPTALGLLNGRMDAALRGHPYVKSAIDMACWDILGKVAGLPVVTLLGGRYGENFPLYRAISQESPEAMAKMVAHYRAEGYTKFQLKVGGDPDTDIERIHQASRQLQRGDVLIADANTGWTQHQALRVADAVRGVDVYLEAALCQLCRVPGGAAAHQPALCSRRGGGQSRDGGGGCGRPGDGRDQSEDFEGRRLDQGAADPRSVRVAGNRAYHRRYLGRRHRHRGHRASGAEHSSRIFIYRYRLQQLRDRKQCHGSPAAPERQHGRTHVAGPRSGTTLGSARQTGNFGLTGARDCILN